MITEGDGEAESCIAIKGGTEAISMRIEVEGVEGGAGEDMKAASSSGLTQ